MYTNLFCAIYNYYNHLYNPDNNGNLIGIDGTYNNDINNNEALNMGFYDISNNIPIDIKSYGIGGKNNEIKSSTDYIKNHIDVFKNNIIVADRGYFSYEFLNFLINNNLKFIIRVKGQGTNLNPLNIIKKNVPNYNKIMNIKDKIRIIKYENVITKLIFSGKSKKKIEKHKIKIKNDCVLVTNILNKIEYNDNQILEYYKSRWDIEVFFKYIKYNFNCSAVQHQKEKYKKDSKKTYLCDLIITFIAKLVERYYINKFCNNNENKDKIKINKSNLTKGIFKHLLYAILNEKLDDNKLDNFCKSYIKIVVNKKDRTFPRNSKTPFTKWYIKGYSDQTKFMKIIDYIINNTVDKLNKNLKTIAKRIINIDDKEYG